MNKNEFIAAVHENKILAELGLSKSAVGAVIDAALDTVQQALKHGDEVRLVGFGNFYVAKREAAKGRNPRTGEDIQIKASKSPKFRAGKLFKDEINAAPAGKHGKK
ncbi:MAG: HU family DNA-binding protein [Alphaproteobacteria bacterium]|nr:HU family DNA-binding protein [Alphaproteobacteria bacterium]